MNVSSKMTVFYLHFCTIHFELYVDKYVCLFVFGQTNLRFCVCVCVCVCVCTALV